MTTRSNLLTSIEHALKKHGVDATAFGVMATNDPNLVFDLRDGRTPRATTIAKIKAALDDLSRRATQET